MKEKDLNFDRKKHICYSKRVKKIINEYLLRHYSETESKNKWEKIQLQYVEFLKDLPYLGGKKSGHNGTGGTYDCIAIFAYYEVLKEKTSINELYEMNNKTFLPSFQALGKIVNANSPIMLRILNMAFVSTAKKDSKNSDERPTGYIMNAEPFDKNRGIYYQFERCPIAEFAKKHNYLDIMPAFCNGDYPALEYIHAGLIRKHTCANSNICDYLIVGDKSPLLKEHQRKVDEKGYWYNE